MRLAQAAVIVANLGISAAAGYLIAAWHLRHMDITQPNTLALALALALANNRIIEYFVAPICDKLEMDRFWLLYISALTGFALALLARADLFTPGLFDPFVSRILSGIVIAGGSNLIHDIIGSPQQQRRTRIITTERIRT